MAVDVMEVPQRVDKCKLIHNVHEASKFITFLSEICSVLCGSMRPVLQAIFVVCCQNGKQKNSDLQINTFPVRGMCFYLSASKTNSAETRYGIPRTSAYIDVSLSVCIKHTLNVVL
jgi:hypothetical protein